MADDVTEPNAPAVDSSVEEKKDKKERSGVTVPAWVAGVLVIVLALGGGFALGRVTDDDHDRPDFGGIVRQFGDRGDNGGNSGNRSGFPGGGGFGGNGGGFPGGGQLPGGGQFPGGGQLPDGRQLPGGGQFPGGLNGPGTQQSPSTTNPSSN